VGISELRTHFDKVMKLIGKCKVVLEKRNRPVAVIVPIEKYDEMEALMEQIEDGGLGHIARDRYRHSKSADYISIDDAEKEAGK
jgi:prevent-host-death family protein